MYIVIIRIEFNPLELMRRIDLFIIQQLQFNFVFQSNYVAKRSFSFFLITIIIMIEAVRGAGGGWIDFVSFLPALTLHHHVTCPNSPVLFGLIVEFISLISIHLRQLGFLTLDSINSSLNQSNFSNTEKIGGFLSHFDHFWNENVQNCCCFDTRLNQFVFKWIKF